MDKLTRISLAITAAGFTGFGIAALIAPKWMLKQVDIRPKSNTGMVELRAMYGGMEIGLGAFFAYCMMKDDLAKPALMAQVGSIGGLAAARVAGMVATPPRKVMYPVAAAEVAATILGLIAMKRECARSRLADIPA
jgi:hypothetical protein